ncbi:MAG: nitrate transporter permease [Planctomycetes bacterium SCN 63-9]|nr:MAG: nitrate transporter permease [Planctomycetes bacterium SCN 63-9]
MPSQVDPASGARLRVLWCSTWAFTALFAVWLMLGILGIEIKKDVPLMFGAAATEGTDPAIVKATVESRFEWLLATAILAGALPRLIFGLWADRYGGRSVMTLLLLFCAVPTYLLGRATSYGELLLAAAFFGLAGNGFTVGISWNNAWFPDEKKGFALGLFGAGNVGAAGTKLLVVLVPTILAIVPPAGYLGGWIAGGWRFIPTFYALILLATAGLIWGICPRPDRKPGEGKPLRELLAPLRYVQVWRFSLYYVVVFGAYVAISAWLPNYYKNTFGLSLKSAALLTSLYIFPASLLRPLGGYLSDRFGPRAVTYAVFLVMLAALMPLCLPTQMLSLGVGGFTALLMVVGAAMGIGKASVFKYIPNYYPESVGAVGGLVGAIGALGGFILPPAFGAIGRSTGSPQSAFLVLFLLTAVSLAWLQLAVTFRIGIRPTGALAAAGGNV